MGKDGLFFVKEKFHQRERDQTLRSRQWDSTSRGRNDSSYSGNPTNQPRNPLQTFPLLSAIPAYPHPHAEHVLALTNRRTLCHQGEIFVLVTASHCQSPRAVKALVMLAVARVAALAKGRFSWNERGWGNGKENMTLRNSSNGGVCSPRDVRLRSETARGALVLVDDWLTASAPQSEFLLPTEFQQGRT